MVRQPHSRWGEWRKSESVRDVRLLVCDGRRKHAELSNVPNSAGVGFVADRCPETLGVCQLFYSLPIGPGRTGLRTSEGLDRSVRAGIPVATANRARLNGRPTIIRSST